MAKFRIPKDGDSTPKPIKFKLPKNESSQFEESVIGEVKLDSQYDAGNLPETNTDIHRQEQQGFGAELGNAIGRTLLTTIPTVTQNIWAIADIEDYNNKDQEVGNHVVRAIEEWKQSINQDYFPVYDGGNSDMGTREWWMNSGSDLATSIGAFVLTGAGIGGALSKAGKGLALIKGLNSLGQYGKAAATVLSATALNQAESITTAVQVYDDTYQFNLQKGLTDDEARQIAADAAAYSININRANILLNLTSAGAFIRSPKATRQLLESVSKRNTLKNILLEGGQEVAEEEINLISQKAGEAQGKGQEYNVTDALNTVFSQEGLESAVLGFIGGAGQTLGTSVVNKLSGLDREQQNRFLAQQEKIKEIQAITDANDVPQFANVFSNIEKQISLQNELQTAIKNNDENRIEQIKNSILENQAYSSFENGTTETLIDTYNKVGSLSQEEAVTKGLDINPSSDSYYKKKSIEAVQTIKDLEKEYNKIDNVINKPEIFFEKVNYRNINNKISDLLVEFNKAKVELEREKINSGLEEDFENKDPKTQDLDTYREMDILGQQISYQRKQLEKSKERLKQIQSPEYQQEIVEKQKEEQIKLVDAQKQFENEQKVNEAEQKIEQKKELESKVKELKKEIKTQKKESEPLEEDNISVPEEEFNQPSLEEMAANLEMEAESISSEKEESIIKEQEIKQTKSEQDGFVKDITDVSKVNSELEDNSLERNGKLIDSNFKFIKEGAKSYRANKVAYLSLEYIKVNTESGFKLEDKYVDGLLQRNTNINSLIETGTVKVGDEISFVIDLTNDLYPVHKDNYLEIPIAIVHGPTQETIGYLHTDSWINEDNIVADIEGEKEKVRRIRQEIFNNPTTKFITKIDSKSFGHLNKNKVQRRLFEGLGDGTKIADNVQLFIGKYPQKGSGFFINPQEEADYTDIINVDPVVEGAIGAILPTAVEGKSMAVYLKTNKLADSEVDIIISAINKHLSGENTVVGDFDLASSEGLKNFLNQITYTRFVSDLKNDSNPTESFYLAFDKESGKLTSVFFSKTKKFKVNELTSPEFRNSLKNKYKSVSLANLNNPNEYYYPTTEEGELTVKSYKNYQTYLSDTETLTTDIQGFKVGETDNYTFFSQPSVEFDSKITSEQEIQVDEKPLPVLIENSIIKDIEGRRQEALKIDTNLEKISGIIISPTGKFAIATGKNEREWFNTLEEAVAEVNARYDAELAKLEQEQTLENLITEKLPEDLDFEGLDDIEVPNEKPETIKSGLADLFVLDGNGNPLYSANQQKQITDSIRREVQLAQQEGLKPKQAFDKAKAVFINGGKKASEKGYANTAARYNQILQPEIWNQFEKFVIYQLRSLGTSIKFIEDTEFEDSNAVEQKLNYDDNSSFYTNTKDTASAEIKKWLSTITKRERNFLGLPVFYDLDFLWDNLSRDLSDLSNDEIMVKLQELGKNAKPEYSVIVEQLSKVPQYVQNEFFVTFNKQTNRHTTLGWVEATKWIKDEKGEWVKVKTGGYEFKNFFSNRNQAELILAEKWQENLKLSQLVTVDNEGNLFINIDLGKKVLESFEVWLNNNPEQNIEQGAEIFHFIGLEIGEQELNEIFNNSKNAIKKKNYKNGKTLLTAEALPIFKTLAGLEKSEKETEDRFELNNPFSLNSPKIRALASLSLDFKPSLFSNSYRDSEGKSRYSFSNNTFLSKEFQKINNQNKEQREAFLKAKQKTSYASTSYWIDQMLTNPKFQEVFNLEYMDGFILEDSGKDAVLLKNSSDREHEMIKMGLLQNQGIKDSNGQRTIKTIDLTPADKTTMPVFSSLGVNITLNGDLGSYKSFGSKADKIFKDMVIAEITRIQETYKQIQSLPEEQKIKNYHNGSKMGTKFMIFPELNDLINPEDLANPDFNIFAEYNDVIVNTINTKINKLILNKKADWENLGIIEKNKIKYADKTYLKNLGFTGPKQLEYTVADYVINYFISNVNISQLISGDPAQHGKEDLTETFINYSKRLAKDIAPALEGNWKKGEKFRTVYLEDSKVDSTHYEDYKKVVGDIAESYKGLNQADAQEYTTLDERRRVAEAFGRLTPELDAAIARLKEGGSNEEDIALALMPDKPRYVGKIINEDLKLEELYYIKTSSFPLIPALTQGLEIDKLRVAMERDGIQRAVFESGVKLGLKKRYSLYKNKDKQELNDFNFSKFSIELPREGFGIQLELPFDPTKAKILEGSQGRKLITANEATTPETAELFKNLHDELTKREFDKLLKRLNIKTGVHKNNIPEIFKDQLEKSGVKEEENYYYIDDLKALQEVIIEEGQGRNWSINEIQSLGFNDKGTFKIPLAFNNASGKIESLLLSLVNNAIVKQKLPGRSYVQGSNFGFHQLSKDAKSQIIWTSKDKSPLKYIRPIFDDKGNVISVGEAEILLPFYFKDNDGNVLNVKDFLNEDGTLDTKRIPKELLRIYGYRIPTQGLNSMMVFKVKGFIPKELEELVIVPAEITAQMGSDFDVDKLFTNRFNYEFDGEKFTKVKFDETIPLEEQSKEAIQNRIVEIYMETILNPKNLDKVLSPITFDPLGEVANEINNTLNAGKEDLGFFYDKSQREIFKSNSGGKAGTGISSLSSVHHALAQKAGLYLKEGKILFDNNTADRLDRVRTLDNKKLISDVISYVQSAAVDNAKEQVLGKTNINNTTFGVAMLLARAGYNEQTIAYFLSQESIKDYVNTMGNIMDSTNLEYDSQKIQKAINELGKKYSGRDFSGIKQSFVVESLGNNRPTNTKDISHYESFLSDEPLNINTSDLKYILYLSGESEKEASYNNTQYNILHAFVYYNQIAKELSNIQSATTADTNGAGKKLSETQQKVDMINSLTKTDFIGNAEKLLDETIVGKFAEYGQIEAVKLFEQLLPFNSNAYKTAKQSIFENMGKMNPKPEDIDFVHNEIKSYVYAMSDVLEVEDVDYTRFKLFFDTTTNKSLSTRIREYKQTSEGQNNWLLTRLITKTKVKEGDISRVEYQNSIAEGVNDSSEGIRAFIELEKSNPELAKDFILYHYLNGGLVTSKSFGKFIPVSSLERLGIAKNLNNVNLNSEETLRNLSEQFFQHFPSKAIKIQDLKDVFPSGKLEKTFTLNDITPGEPNSHSQFYVEKINEYGKKVQTYPNYLSYREGKKWLLFKAEGYTYKQIDTLGKQGFKEYTPSNSTQESLLQENSVENITIQSRIPTFTRELIQDKSETLKVAPVQLSVDDIETAYALNENNLKKTVDIILDNRKDQENHISILLNTFKEKGYLNNLTTTIKINNEATFGGNYNSGTDIITLNPKILKDNSSSNDEIFDKLEHKFTHELVHALTLKKLATDSINKKAIQGLLGKSFNELIVDKNEYRNFVLFNQARFKYKRGKELTSEESTVFNPENKDKYYGFSILEEHLDKFQLNKVPNNAYIYLNIYDFVAEGLVNQSFAKGLGSVEFNSKRTLFGRLLDLVTKVLGIEKQGTVLENLINETFNLIDGTTSVEQTDESDDIEAPSKPKKKDKRKKLEFTQIDSIDTYIKRWNTQIVNLKKQIKEGSDAKNLIIESRIDALQAKIDNTIEAKNEYVILETANEQLNWIEEQLSKEGLQLSELKQFEDYLSIYADLNKIVRFEDEFKEDQDVANRLTGKAQYLLNKLSNVSIDHITEYLNKYTKRENPYTKEELFGSQKETGAFTGNFMDAGASRVPVVQLVNEVIQKMVVDINEDYTNFENKFIELDKEFKEYQKSKGISDSKIFDSLLQKDSKGNLTGNLVNTYKQEFYDQLKKKSKEARETGNWRAYWNWYNQNSSLELTKEMEEEYNKDLELAKELFSDSSGNIVDEAGLMNWIEENSPKRYLELVKQKKSTDGYKGFKYLEHKPIKKWEDPQYNQLMSLPDSNPVKKYYLYWRHEMSNIRKRLPKTKTQKNYIPEIKKDFFNDIKDNGLKEGFKGIKESLLSNLSSDLEAVKSYQNVDPVTGKDIPTIPFYMFGDKLLTKDKDFNLSKVLLATKAQQLGFTHKSKVEDLVLLAKRRFAESSELETTYDEKGNVVVKIDRYGDKKTLSKGNYKTIEQLDHLINSIIYDNRKNIEGITSKKVKVGEEKDKIGEEEKKDVYENISMTGITDSLIGYTQLKAMAFNVFNAVTNFSFGVTGNMIEGAGGNNFTLKNAVKSFGNMVAATVPGTESNKKVTFLMKYFDVLVESNEIKYGRIKAVQDKYSQGLSSDKLFIMQKAGEFLAQGQTMGATLRSTEIEDLKGNKKSVWDAFIVDDKGNTKWDVANFGPNPYEPTVDKEGNIIASDEKYKLQSKIRDIVMDVHGNYDPNSPQLFKRTWYGRLLGQFRLNWMAQGIHVRFADKYYHEKSGKFKRGRYNTIWGKDGFMYNEDGILDLQRLKTNLKWLVGINPAEMSDLDKANIRKVFAELAMISSMTILGLTLKSLTLDDDDEEKGVVTFFINQSYRLNRDLTFYLNPNSFKEVTKEVVPAIRTATDFIDLLPATYDLIMGKDEITRGTFKGQSKLFYKTKKAFPIIKQFDNFRLFTDQILDR